MVTSRPCQPLNHRNGVKTCDKTWEVLSGSFEQMPTATPGEEIVKPTTPEIISIWNRDSTTFNESCFFCIDAICRERQRMKEKLKFHQKKSHLMIDPSINYISVFCNLRVKDVSEGKRCIRWNFQLFKCFHQFFFVGCKTSSSSIFVKKWLLLISWEKMKNKKIRKLKGNFHWKGF